MFSFCTLASMRMQFCKIEIAAAPRRLGRFDARRDLRLVSIRRITCSPSLSLVSAIRGRRSGLRWIGTHEKRARREGARTSAALRFACSSAVVFVWSSDSKEEEEEACLECQQIRKCLLSFFRSADMPFRSPYGIASPFMEDLIASATESI